VATTEALAAIRQEVEAFLFEEAAILDDWRLDDWAALFTEDARYVVPATDARHADPNVTLGLIDDDIVRIRGRVERLKSRHAHREFPSSRTRRLITNVRVLKTTDDAIQATANFLVSRVRNGQTDHMVGRYLYTLVRAGNGLKIRSRRAELEAETLAPHGTVSIIL
jgi:p-cumate 2,3-dioxygenase beta subunit